MPQKFYKTVITYEVLSEEPLPDGASLETIHSMTYDGDCVGRFGKTTETELTGKEAADALYAFGSEPGFFQLDDDGKPLDKLYAVSISHLHPECEESVLVDCDGNATNRWADGTVGVQEQYQRAAEEAFDPDSDPVVPA